MTLDISEGITVGTRQQNEHFPDTLRADVP